MKPLILGLGNSVMGDDAAGIRVVEMLAADANVTDRAELWTAGTDVLRAMDRIDGREGVILVDAVERADAAEQVSVVDGPLPDRPGGHAHWLSAAQSVELMRRALPSLRETKFTWVLVPIESASAHETLSPSAAALVPLAAAAVKALL